MTRSIAVEISGHSFEVLGERGLFWSSQQTLFVADTHFGKEATFRRHGIPVPVGSTQATLDAIGRMLETTKASRMVILGDMFHARSSLSPDVVESLTQFFDQYKHVMFTLIRGNHDARLGQLPTAWQLSIEEPIEWMGRVALGHHPAKPPSGADVYLCGHIHPALRLGSRRDRLGKLPCFWLHDGCFVLPAIGDFTGTHQIELGPSDKAWFVADGEIFCH